jgi:hypothetical protein
MMPASIRWLRRAASATAAALLLGLLPATPASAGHVAPLIGVDVNLANLAGDERELNIVVDPANPNRLAAGANDRENGGPGQRWYSSTDGGRTWTNGALPRGTLTLDGVPTDTTAMSDPSLDFGTDGTLYYSALIHAGNTEPCTLFVVSSPDMGATWTDAADGIVRAGTQADDECNDKEHIAVDRANNNNVYVAWTPIRGPLSWEAVFSRDLNGSADGFAFSAATVLSTGAALDGCLNQGADFALDPNTGPTGTIYVAWTSFCSGFAHGDPGTVYVVRSVDQGASWSAPVAAATLDNANPPLGFGFRSRSHPSIAVDPATGRVYVVYASNADAAANSNSDIMMVSSPAGGAVWTAPMRVNTDAGTTHQVLPWIDVANGRIHVIFSSRTGPSGSWNTQVAYAPSGPAPTFTEVTVSAATTPVTTGFIGDYHGIIVGPDDVVHPAWADGRTGTGGGTDAFSMRLDFSPPTTLQVVPATQSLEVGLTADMTATVRGAHGEAEQFIPVTFSVGGGGTPSSSGASSTTNALGKASFSFSNTQPGTNPVSVFADLNENETQDAGETRVVDVQWVNSPPVVDAGPGVAIPEGSPALLTGSATDPSGDPLTLSWSFAPGPGVDAGASCSFSAPGSEVTSITCDDDGPFTATLTASDGVNPPVSDDATVTVSNVAPTVVLAPGQVSAIAEGDVVGIEVRFSDPGSNDTYGSAFDWGHADLGVDPGTVAVLSEGPPRDEGEARAAKRFGDNGAFTVIGTVSDDDGGAGSASFTLSVGNVLPTAALDRSSAIDVNGTPTFITRVGQPTSFTGGSADPGSDDLTLRWHFGDGTPVVAVTSLVNAPILDPFPSPSNQARDVSNTAAHVYVDPCPYLLTFSSADDDQPGQRVSDSAPVIVTGNADRLRSAGYWHQQYGDRGARDFTPSTLACYLDVAGHMSTVFHEEVDASTIGAARAVLFPGGSKGDPSVQLDRQLLAAWLNFANGAIGLDTLVDTDGDGVADTTFGTVVAAAEETRLDPGASTTQLVATKDALERINTMHG